MGLTADTAFGVEPIKVGTFEVPVDMCSLADMFYDALANQEKDETGFKEMLISKVSINNVLSKIGFPHFECSAAACKFANEVMLRALELKKAVGDVLAFAVEPASPDFTQDSTLNG